MSCADFDQHLDAWLAGTLDDAKARDLELHAAECAACGARLDALSVVASLPRELAPPPLLRAVTLRAVAQRRGRVRWRSAMTSVAAIAALVFLAIAIQPRRKSASDFPGAARVLLAQAHARPEIAELDDAERDIQSALQQHPGDAELTGALARVRRQRDALRELVQAVNR